MSHGLSTSARGQRERTHARADERAPRRAAGPLNRRVKPRAPLSPGRQEGSSFWARVSGHRGAGARCRASRTLPQALSGPLVARIDRRARALHVLRRRADRRNLPPHPPFLHPTLSLAAPARRSSCAMNSEDKRVVVKQYIESRYTRVNKLKAEREARKQTLQASGPPAPRPWSRRAPSPSSLSAPPRRPCRRIHTTERELHAPPPRRPR